MAPTEKSAKDSAKLQEYMDGRSRLTVLHNRIIEAGKSMMHTGRELHSGKPAPNVDRTLEQLDVLKETLDDYRATRKRCADLYQYMGRYDGQRHQRPLGVSPGTEYRCRWWRIAASGQDRRLRLVGLQAGGEPTRGRCAPAGDGDREGVNEPRLPHHRLRVTR